jgi:hypothetical protein
MLPTIQLHHDDYTGIYTERTDGGDVTFTPFIVDYFAEQTDGECSLCGLTIDAGWLCLDGGEEFCNGHIEVTA